MLVFLVLVFENSESRPYFIIPHVKNCSLFRIPFAHYRCFWSNKSWVRVEVPLVPCKVIIKQNVILDDSMI